MELADVPELEPVELPFEYMLLFEPEGEVPVLVPLVVIPGVPDVPAALPVPCMVPFEYCLLLVSEAVLPALVPVPLVSVPLILPLLNCLFPVPVPVDVAGSAAWTAVSAAWTAAKTLAIEKAAAAVVITTFDTFMMVLQ